MITDSGLPGTYPSSAVRERDAADRSPAPPAPGGTIVTPETMATQRPAPASGLGGAYAAVARPDDPVESADEKPASGGRVGTPRNLLDLLDRWFSEPSWSRTLQIVLVLAVVLVGLAFVALAAADASPLWWSAVGVAAAGGAGLAQRRRREQRTQQRQGDESSR